LRRPGRRQGSNQPHRRGDGGQGPGLRHRRRLLRPRQHHPPRLPGPPAAPPPGARGGLLRAGGGADRARGPAQEDRGPGRLVRGGAQGRGPPALEPWREAGQGAAGLLPGWDGPLLRGGGRGPRAAGGAAAHGPGGFGEAEGVHREVRLRVRGAAAGGV
ncbi:MAG: hypothetical protein AVDCRST_MAG22-1091, partial [uncultured Rubrobacteraceae bacterium]